MALEPVSSVINKCRPRWFRRAEYDDAVWIICYIVMEVDGRRTGMVLDMNSFSLCQKTAQFQNKSRTKITRQPVNPRSTVQVT